MPFRVKWQQVAHHRFFIDLSIFKQFSISFQNGQRIIKKERTCAKRQLSKAPLWPKMFGIACLRLAISQDIDGLSRNDCCFTEDATAALCNTAFLPGAAEEQPALPWTGNRWQREKNKAFATYSYHQQFCNTFERIQALCSTLVPELTGALRNFAAPFYLLKTEPDLFKFSFFFGFVCVCFLDSMNKRREEGKK